METCVTDIDGATIMEVIDDERFYDAFEGVGMGRLCYFKKVTEDN